MCQSCQTWPAKGLTQDWSFAIGIFFVSFCHHLASVVRRKLSHLNLLLWNAWTKLNQTWQGWSLGGSLSKLCPTDPPSKIWTDTRLVFCNRKLMRTDIFFTRTTKLICNFANSVNRLKKLKWRPINPVLIEIWNIQSRKLARDRRTASDKFPGGTIYVRWAIQAHLSL
jgi:hypothetical protein